MAAKERRLERKKVVELEAEGIKQDGPSSKATKHTEKEGTLDDPSTQDTGKKHTLVASIRSTESTTTTTATTSGKRGRNTGNEQKPNKHGGKRVAVYGNYDHYYSYRVLKDSDEDPRLKYFKCDWFEGKDCLDVGCNTGNLTISIAMYFKCKTMTGVDIDRGLVQRACNLLEKTAKSLVKIDRNGQSRTLNEKVSSTTTSIDHKPGTFNDGLSGEELLRRVSFKAENFVTHMEAKPIYDTVLCLSVTKWVHLNWGDDGLIKLFAKIRNLLRPGGILVLEPQPWKSYKNNHLVSEVVRKNFHEIVLRPDQFKEILLDRIGFRSMQSITEEIESSVKGFSRPIYLLRC